MKIISYRNLSLVITLITIILLLALDNYSVNLASWTTNFVFFLGYSDFPELSSKLMAMISLSDRISAFVYILICLIAFINFKVISGSVDWKLIFISLFSILILNGFIEHIWLRRGIFSLLFFPTILFFSIKTHRYFTHKAEDRASKRALIFFNAIFWSTLLIPGFYVPPFFDGIAGWTTANYSAKGYTVQDIRIQFDDGHYEWFRPSFYNPMTQAGRPFSAIKKRDRAFFYSSKFSCFLYKLYQKSHLSLRRNKLPTQLLLGSFSYPPHNTDSFPNNANYLPADRISLFQLVKIHKEGGGKKYVDILFEWNAINETCDNLNINTKL